MDKILTKSFFDYLEANPLTTEEQFKTLIISQSDHTEETITEFLTGFYTGLWKNFIIDSPEYSIMLNKIINHDDLNIDTIVILIEEYFKDNPLQYKLKQELDFVNSKIIEAKALPDEILVSNTAKFSELEMLQNEKIHIEIQMTGE